VEVRGTVARLILCDQQRLVSPVHLFYRDAVRPPPHRGESPYLPV